MHYYEHNIGDYRKDTSHLSLLEHGIYRQLIDTYYLSESPLTKDLDKLMRTHSIRNADEKQSLQNVLNDFFELTENGYIHKRCDQVIAEYHGKSEKARASANARWANKNKAVDANALQAQSEGNANHKPLTINHKPNIESAKAPKAKRLEKDLELPKDWEDFCKTTRSDLKPQEVFDQFKDYWVSIGGQKGTKLDWTATWRNWVRNQRQQSVTTQDKPYGRWDATLASTMARGKELGILPKVGETEGQYRERLKQGGA